MLLAVSTCLSIIYLDQTGIALTLNAMQQALGLSNTGIEWVVNIYLLTLAVFMLLGGRLADMFGHRKLFLIGMIFFLLSSMGCALSTHGWEIIMSRCLQGFGGALLIPTGLVLVAQSAEKHERGKMLGICVSFASIFLALGPTIGGMLTQLWNWRLFFWINIPMGLISIFLAVLSCDARKKENHSTTIDWGGFITLAISLTSLIVALMQAAFWGWSSLLTIGLLVHSFLFFILFLCIESKVKSPLIHLHFFKNKVFSGGNAILLLLQTCHISGAVFWALYLQHALGYSAGQAGLLILPTTAPAIFLAQMSGRLLDRYGPRLPIGIGVCLSTMGVLWVAIFSNDCRYVSLLPGFILYGIGAPLALPSAVTSTILSIPPEDHGMASGIANTMRQIGGTFGLSVIGAIITNRSSASYVSAFSDSMIIGTFFMLLALIITLFVFKNRQTLSHYQEPATSSPPPPSFLQAE